MHMVRSGIVKSVDRTYNCGVIEDKNGNEFFFNGSECLEGELPAQWSVVTFVKDPDYKSTKVAMLIQPMNNKAVGF
jgi:hypothetical protein